VERREAVSGDGGSAGWGGVGMDGGREGRVKMEEEEGMDIVGGGEE